MLFCKKCQKCRGCYKDKNLWICSGCGREVEKEEKPK